MPSRAKRTSSWQEPLENVARAKKFVERFGLQEAHPDDYLDPLPKSEEAAWGALISKIS